MKNTVAHLGMAALLTLALGLFSGSAFGATSSTPEFKEVVKWGVWHEGCRIYSSDNSIGDVEQIRECLITVFQQNPDIQQTLRHATKLSLASAVRAAGNEIPAERQYDRFFEFACKSKGLLANFQKLAEANDYDAVRSLYYETFKSQAEIRNLLAAVSNRDLGSLLQQIDLSVRVQQMQSGAAHEPMSQGD